MAYDIRYAQYIDHTVLKPDTTRATLRRFCDEAKKYGFASVCVNPCNVPFVVKELAGTPVKTAAVVGFPLGANTTHIKAEEAREAVANGAREIDMVINIAALKEGELDYVREEIRAVVEASHPEALVKVILEISALTDEEIATGLPTSRKSAPVSWPRRWARTGSKPPPATAAAAPPSRR